MDFTAIQASSATCTQRQKSKRSGLLQCMLFIYKAQKSIWVSVHKRRDPSPKKCMHWKVYYISTVFMDFLPNKKGLVFSSSLPENLTGEWAGGLYALMKTIKESLESWKLSLLAQSSCQNWLNFRHPFSSPAQKRKRWVAGGKRCVFDSLCSLIEIIHGDYFHMANTNSNITNVAWNYWE